MGRPSKKKKVKEIQLAVVLVLSGLCPALASSAPKVFYEVENVQVMSSINLHELEVSTSNLTNYIGLLKENKGLLGHFESNQQRKHDELYTNALVNQLNFTASEVGAMVEALVGRNISISEESAMVKRGVGTFIGNGMSLLFGVAGPNDVQMFNRAIVNLNSSMSKQHEFNQMVIDGQRIESKILHQHTDILRNLSRVADKNYRDRTYLQNNDLKTKELLTISNHVMVWNHKIESSCTEAELSISDARNGFLSERTINPKDLQRVLQRISQGSQTTSPLFADASHYYKHKLTRVAIHAKHLTIAVTIPLIDFRENNVLRKISREEKLSSHHDIMAFSYVAEDTNRRTYSLLEQADIDHALQVDSAILIRKRRLEYYTHNFGNVKLGDYVGQWLDYETLILAAKSPFEAHLACTESKQKILLKSSVITIPLNCNLMSDFFNVPNIKEKSLGRERHFRMDLEHPMIATFDKDPEHFPGYTAIQSALNNTEAELRLANEKIANESRKNEEIKDKLAQVETIMYSSGGGLTLFMLILSFSVIFCLCYNCGTIHHPCC